MSVSIPRAKEAMTRGEWRKFLSRQPVPKLVNLIARQDRELERLRERVNKASKWGL